MAAFLIAMTGCQKEPQQNEGLSSDDKVYMKFSIQTLTTRSATDNEDEDGYGSSNATPDVEVGRPEENAISTIDIVLRNQTSYVCTTVTPTLDPDTNTDKNQYVATFPNSQLLAGETYSVYIYANCSAKQDIDATTANVAIGDMTQNNKFWMTNAYEAATVTLPDDLSTYNSAEKAFGLGEHYIERAMARFDYMPKGAYTLQKDENENATVTITLTKAALINQSNNSYLLRRVSADGTATNRVIGGAETKINYVVDTDYAAKNDGYQEADAKNFTYHLSAPNEWEWKGITADDLKIADKWEGVAGEGEHNLNQYYYWQYAKENTIPGAYSNQQNGLSTGVVFKGELSGTNVPANGTEAIYVFDNVLYGTWAQVKEAAETNETLKFYTDKYQATDYEELGKAGFTSYKPEDGKYYAYYYYWNRHNDNGNNTDMGRMEFAVVRNNVYKLCVDEIVKFGHPDPEDPNPVDPDPVDPTDPDESGEYYFKVTVKVLPWVVRVNHIGF